MATRWFDVHGSPWLSKHILLLNIYLHSDLGILSPAPAPHLGLFLVGSFLTPVSPPSAHGKRLGPPGVVSADTGTRPSALQFWGKHGRLEWLLRSPLDKRDSIQLRQLCNLSHYSEAFFSHPSHPGIYPLPLVTWRKSEPNRATKSGAATLSHILARFCSFQFSPGVLYWKSKTIREVTTAILLLYQDSRCSFLGHSNSTSFYLF